MTKDENEKKDREKDKSILLKFMVLLIILVIVLTIALPYLNIQLVDFVRKFNSVSSDQKTTINVVSTIQELHKESTLNVLVCNKDITYTIEKDDRIVNFLFIHGTVPGTYQKMAIHYELAVQYGIDLNRLNENDIQQSGNIVHITLTKPFITSAEVKNDHVSSIDSGVLVPDLKQSDVSKQGNDDYTNVLREYGRLTIAKDSELELQAMENTSKIMTDIIRKITSNDKIDVQVSFR